MAELAKHLTGEWPEFSSRLRNPYYRNPRLADWRVVGFAPEQTSFPDRHTRLIGALRVDREIPLNAAQPLQLDDGQGRASACGVVAGVFQFC